MRRVVVLLSAAALLVACGDGDGAVDDAGAAGATPGASSGSSPAAAPGASSSPSAQAGGAGASAEAGDGGASVDTSTKPEVTVASDEAPPEELVIEDLVVGDGEEAQVGDAVAVQYVGASWSDGQEFDASWDRGAPFRFTLGEGRVIEGWDEGLVGMREGGRRRLVIPPELGYGQRGAGEVIGPGETLVFVVDLLEIQ